VHRGGLMRRRRGGAVRCGAGRKRRDEDGEGGRKTTRLL
jgi:hypothetical protein